MTENEEIAPRSYWKSLSQDEKSAFIQRMNEKHDQAFSQENVDREFENIDSELRKWIGVSALAHAIKNAQ